MQELETFEEQDVDSDYDYEETYTKRKKRKTSKPSRHSTANENTTGRRSTKVNIINIEAINYLFISLAKLILFFETLNFHLRIS